MSNRNMALDVLVRLRDQLSRPLRGLLNQFRQFGDFTRRIGILGAAIGAISFMGPITEAAAFQQKLLDIAGTAELTGSAAFAFVDQAAAKYEGLALKIGQASDTVAAGAGQMIAAGVDLGVIDRNIGMIGKAATAANTEFADMAAVVTSAVKTLNVPETEIEGMLAGLVVAGKEGAFELKDMARVYPQLTGQMKKFGITGREASNQLAAMLQIAKMGTSDPAQAANNLNNFLSKALSPVTQKNFKDMRVDIEAVMMDATAKGMNPLEAMLQKIGKLTGVSEKAIGKYMATAKSKGLEGADALEFVKQQLEAIGAAGKLGELFGDQQVLDFLIPMMANIEEYKRIRDKVAAATGQVIDKDFETQMAGINRELVTLQEIGTQSVRMVGFAFAEWLPAINEWLIAALGWVRDIDQSTGGMVKRALSFAGAGLLVVSALGALGIALPIVGAGLSAIAGLIGLVLSPLGIFVGLLAAGGAYVWKNWDRYGPQLMRLWDRAKRTFGDFAQEVQRRGERIVDGARDLWRRYGPAIRTAIEGTWSSALDIANRYGPRVRKAFADTWADLKAGSTAFADGFMRGATGIGEEWEALATKLTGVGGQLKAIFADIMSIVAKVPGADKADWGSIGEMFGSAFKSQLETIGVLTGGLEKLLGVVKEFTGWLDKAEPGSWKKLIPDAIVQTARDLLNPLGAIGTHVGELKALFDKGVNANWSALLPWWVVAVGNMIGAAVQWVEDSVRKLVDMIRAPLSKEFWTSLLPWWVVAVGNMIGAAVQWVKDSVRKLVDMIRAPLSKEFWTSLLPWWVVAVGNMIGAAVQWVKDSVGKLVDMIRAPLSKEFWTSLLPDEVVQWAGNIKTALDGVVTAINSVVGAFKSLQGLGSLPNPFGPHSAPATGPKVGPFGMPMPSGTPSAPPAGYKQSALSSPTKFAALQPPVRLDGKVNVSVKVEGQGKVTGVTSDNDSVKVAASGGRMVGTV